MKPEDEAYFKARYDFFMDNMETMILGILENDAEFASLKGPFEKMLEDLKLKDMIFQVQQASEKA